MMSTLSSRFLCITVLATVSILLSLNASSQVWTFRNGFGQNDAGSGFPDIGRAVCTDASGNVYITGKISDATIGNTVNFGGGALTSAGDDDGFVAKFNSSGVHQWSLRFGGALLDEGGYGIVTDGTSVYVVGEANGGMTVGSSIINYPSVGGGIDGFVMKLDAATGATVSWVTRFGGGNSDRAQAVCLDPSGSIYISGYFRTRTANPTATFGSFSATVQGNTTAYTTDLFAAALNSSGTFLWASTGGSAGGNDNIVGSGICYVPSLSEVVVVGNYRSLTGVVGSTTATYATSVPASLVVLTNASGTTNEDFCLLEIAAPNGAFISGSGVGAGDGNEAGLGIIYDPFTSDVYFAGYFSSASTTFPGNPANTNPATNDNILYGRYNPATNAYTWIKDADNGTSGTAADVARSITTNGTGNVFIAGNFRNTATFPGGAVISASGVQSDVFVAKINVANGNAVFASQGTGTSATADDIANGIATAPGNNVWITGQYASSITLAPLAALASQGNTEDILLAKFNDPPPAVVTSVAVPPNSTYGIGTQLNFTVNWNEAVTVTGSPFITLTIGASVEHASYVSGSGTTALLFRYTVSCNDFDNNGISVGALSLNGGTIRNTAAPAVNAILTLNNVGSTTLVNVNANAPVVNAPTVTQPTCVMPSGTIVVNATGNSVLEYSIDNGSTFQVSNTFSGLAPGNYNIVVNFTGFSCSTTYSSNPVVINSVPSVSVDAPTVTQPACATTGTIVVNATGSGTLEYSIDGGANWSLSNTFNGLAAGNYTIQARLQSNPACVASYSGNPVVLNAATGCCVAPVINAPSVTQPTCALPTGTIVVNATGGGTLEYQLNAGSFQSSNSFSGLEPGNYNITVRLQSSPACLATYSGNPVVLNAATGCCVAPVINAPTVTQPTCALPTGTIVVNATGSGTLEYQLNAGSFQSSNSFSGLEPGNYNITVRLQSSPACLATYSGNPVLLSAATGCCVALVINAPSVTQPTCALATGTIEVNATGGGTLEYQLNAGSFQLSNTFSGLEPGNYNITVRLQSSPACLSTYNGNPVVLSAATGCCTTPVSAGTLGGPSAMCQGESINITHTGNTRNYGSVVFQGGVVIAAYRAVEEVEGFLATATPGQYCLYVFAYASAPTCGDITGFSLAQVIDQCFAGQCYDVTEPLCITVNAPPTITAPTVTQPTCATSTGKIVVNATGTGTLEYQLNAGAFQVSNSFSGLTPGNYSITVRLQSSPACLSTYSGNPVVLSAATGCCVAPVINAPTVTQPTCTTTTGKIIVNATGSGVLEYSINGGTNWFTSNTFNGVTAGSYTIKVRLQSSPTCSATYSGNPVTINATTGCCAGVVVNAPTVTQPTCSVLTGKIVVNATGTGTLQYRLNSGTWQTSNTFYSLPTGNYNISVRLKYNTSCVTNYSGNPVTLSAATGCAACTLTCPANITVNNKTGYCGAYVSYSVTQTGNCGTPSCSKPSGAFFPIGTTPVTVTSSTGASCSFTVTVLDKQKPDIVCPADITVTAASNSCSKMVNFTVTAVDNCPGAVTITTVPASGSTFPAGITIVTATAKDAAGNQAISTFTVKVKESQPPVIKTVATPIVLTWPANGSYQTINVSQCVITVTDNCSSIPVSSVKIIKVTSDESENANGDADGNTTKDIKIASDCKSVELRRERKSNGNGRVYSIYLLVTDAGGNTGTATFKVYAPITQSGTTATDNGAEYTVYSYCGGNIQSRPGETVTKIQPAIEIPEGFKIEQNYPNPFTTITSIRYAIPSEAQVSLAVYNQLGQKVAQLTEGRMSAGYHQARFDATKLAAGIYLYRLLAVDANGKPFVLNKTMIVAK